MNAPITRLVLLACLILAACNVSAQGDTVPPEADESEGPRLRRVWANAGDYAHPSPDGNLITYVDWSTGDVAVHDIRSGEARRVTNKGTWEENGSWAEEPHFSPDGEEIVYTYGNVKTGDPFRYELRVVNVADGTDRLLYPIEVADEWIAVMDWHPDAGMLVEYNRGDGSSDLGVVSPSDGDLRILRSFAPNEGHPHGAFLDADGNRIVYRTGGDLRMIRIDGSADTDLKISDAMLIGWSADGRSVLFHADRDGTRGIWSLPISGVRPAGEPISVQPGIPSIIPGGFSKSGYYYAIPVDGPRLYLTAVDVEKGGLLAQPAALTEPGEGWAETPAWSPDGRRFAYSVRGLNEGVKIMVRTAEGDNVREIASIRQERIFRLAWSQDGESLFYIANGAKAPALYRLTFQNGKAEKLLEPSGRNFALTQDGRSVVLSLHEAIVVHDLESGRQKRLTTHARSVDVALSPDGETVAYLHRDSLGSRIRSMPLAGGEPQTVLDLDEGLHVESLGATLAYTPDGRSLIAVVGDTANAHQILSIPLSGGEPRVLIDFPSIPQGSFIRPHAGLQPGGRRMVYSMGTHRVELWLMEDFPGQTD